MGDSFSKVVSIFICAILMFIIPVFYMKEETRRVTQTCVIDYMTEYIDGVRNTGIMDPQDYLEFQKTVYSLGGGYSIGLTHCIHNYDEDRESVLYFQEEVYTPQIMEYFIKGERYYMAKYDYIRMVIKDVSGNVVGWYGGSIRNEAY